MSVNFKVIRAIIRKDLLGLLPLVLLSLAVFIIQPVMANLNLEAMVGDSEFWVNLTAKFYWLGYFLASLLLISVLQQDPAVSLHHDWLTRPVARTDLLLAKILFLVLTVCVPVVLSRFLMNLGNDFSLAVSLSYAFAIEKLPAMLPVPLLFAVALLTPTLRKTIFVLVMAVMVFILPAWSVSRPLLEMIGIDFGGEFSGMMWVQGLPIVAVGVAGSAFIYWLLYKRRQERKAYWVFAGMLAIVFISVFPPAPLYDWNDAIAINKALINSPDATLEESVILEHATACFPAAEMGNDNIDSQSDALLAQAAWTDLPQRFIGSGAITFATTVRSRDMLVEWFVPSEMNRELSVDWRIDRLRTRGRITADALDADIQLLRSPTALNRYAPIAGTDTDYWLLAGEYVQRLAQDPSTRLVIDFDMALLSPVVYELQTDGLRREYPELGSCKAEVDIGANTIDVDCVKRGARADLVAAELIGVPASRVDSHLRSSTMPRWIEALGREHYELSVQFPLLVDTKAVMLTAYKLERLVHKQLVTKGLLGAAASLCPLPSDARFATIERSSWGDKSPHEVSSVAVERGVRVEVIDWRQGVIKDAPTLFLLPGLGATVHSYDELAVKLAQKYNVIGMTRRGVGESSKPDHGYDIARLSQDVIEVLNTLEIDAPILVGHSIAGEELSFLGAHFPERFSGLVYLDAAYDRTDNIDERLRQLNATLPEAPPVHPAETVSYAALLNYAQRTGRARNIPEGEILASYELDTGRIKHNSLYLDAIMMGLQPPEYERITIPALGIFAVPGSPAALMEAWYDQDDLTVQQTLSELFEKEKAMKLAAIARFDREIPTSTALALENAGHWIFLSHETQVLEAIDEFIARLH